MAKFKLRPWKFGKDEKMRLHWISSPFKKNKKWTVKAVFVPDSLKEDATSLFKYGGAQLHTIIEMTWGLLPNLRVGRVYKDGIIGKPSKSLSRKILSIATFQNGSICDASEMPKEFYDFYDDRLFSKEKLMPS